jgi:hypothetical protein
VPLIASSPEQLRELLSAVGYNRKVINIRESNIITSGEPVIGGDGSRGYLYLEFEETVSHGSVVLHLEAVVELSGSGSFWQINDCEEDGYYTGAAAPWAPVYPDTHHHITANKQYILIQGEGDLYTLFWYPEPAPAGEWMFIFITTLYVDINYFLSGG